MGTLSGYYTHEGTLSETENKVSGNLSNQVIQLLPSDLEQYKGDYEITPTTSSQELETENKLLNKNVTVKSIPYFSVSNNKGGDTVVIGGN